MRIADRTVASFVACVALGTSACAPLALTRERMLGEIAANYRAFFPPGPKGDPDSSRDAGLLRPRFGFPALARVGTSFEIELIERGGPVAVRAALVRSSLGADGATACAAPDPAAAGCYPLALGPAVRTPITDGVAEVRFAARSQDAPPGDYDLYLASPVDAPARSPRAVWLSVEDPAAPRPLRIAHLSDLHVGKWTVPHLDERLRAVIRELNAAAPDLVVISGDVVDRGGDETLTPRAQEMLLAIDAPLLVVVGNHDLGFGPRAIFTDRHGAGWSNFARAFHPFLFFQLTLGGFDFVGFDSGPSVPSPRVLTRGLAPGTVESLREAIASSRTAGHRGVVLFSHAPSRAKLSSGGDPVEPGQVGQMDFGGESFERALLDAAHAGQFSLHLAGHTHWTDVYESRLASDGELQFVRWPKGTLSPCFRPLGGRSAMVTIQAATHSGLPFKESARGWGFAWLLLGAGAPQIAFPRYGIEATAAVCSSPALDLVAPHRR
ncbi:MAG: metallophosphoesterase [Myxococcales bacterium]|nr:metallophosphoesterase [Myxococcales bacterium]